MPRSPNGWKECGLDTSPPRPRPTTRQAWLEIHVGRYQIRLARAAVLMPAADYDAFHQWVYDPLWLNGAHDG